MPKTNLPITPVTSRQAARATAPFAAPRGITLVKLIVPLVLFAVVAFIGYALFSTSAKPAANAPGQTGASQPNATPGSTSPSPAQFAPAQPATPIATDPTASTQPATQPTSEPTSQRPVPLPLPTIDGLVASRVPLASWAPLGELKPRNQTTDNDPQMRVVFSPLGAGIAELKLSEHFESIEKNAEHQVLQQIESHVIPTEVRNADGSTTPSQLTFTLVPMSMSGVQINGTYVPLDQVDATSTPWEQLAPGHFAATIVDSAKVPVLKVTRKFILQPGRYDMLLDQSFENLTSKPLSVLFVSLGPADLPVGVIRYGGDIRRVRKGFVPGPEQNPDGSFVGGKDFIPHATALGAAVVGTTVSWPEMVFYPTKETKERNIDLSWYATTNRYFAVAVHPLPERQPKRTDLGAPVLDRRMANIMQLDRVVLSRDPVKGRYEPNAVMALRSTSKQFFLAPAGSNNSRFDASVGIYAGPITKGIIGKDPVLSSVKLTDLEVYSFGGPCAFCTFQPVAHLLRGFVSTLRNYVTFDWALAIILLVVCVRTILHPITKWSQTSLQRFGKQMQKLAPKQKALQEKYKDDPTKMRAEMANLMREEQVNYAGALGCLPMFLQMPIWIALYATIFFLFDLRHEPAFFGVIQSLTGGNWTFLADLAEPDHFIKLPTSINVPFISGLMGPIDGINILPLLLGVVFFIQAKYLQPPSTTELSPEMEMQQKIMKVMMVVMMPVFMYNAPAALSIYFITNSALGILESKYIRKKFEEDEKFREEQEKLNPRKKEPKPLGFFAKLQQRALEAQAKAQQAAQAKAADPNKKRTR